MNEVTCFLSCFDAKNKKSESANGGEAPPRGRLFSATTELKTSEKSEGVYIPNNVALIVLRLDN